jgi:hypothetical protein
MGAASGWIVIISPSLFQAHTNIPTLYGFEARWDAAGV